MLKHQTRSRGPGWLLQQFRLQFHQASVEFRMTQDRVGGNPPGVRPGTMFQHTQNGLLQPGRDLADLRKPKHPDSIANRDGNNVLRLDSNRSIGVLSKEITIRFDERHGGVDSHAPAVCVAGVEGRYRSDRNRVYGKRVRGHTLNHADVFERRRVQRNARNLTSAVEVRSASAPNTDASINQFFGTTLIRKI